MTTSVYDRLLVELKAEFPVAQTVGSPQPLEELGDEEKWLVFDGSKSDCFEIRKGGDLLENGFMIKG